MPDEDAGDTDEPVDDDDDETAGDDEAADPRRSAGPPPAHDRRPPVREPASAAYGPRPGQPLTDPVLHGRRDWLVLNGTYLVDAGAGEFSAAVAELDRAVPDIRLELTGPWPPYSFAGVDRATS